ncbi:MAG: ROK family protein [Akkermansiaceae bacterium]
MMHQFIPLHLKTQNFHQAVAENSRSFPAKLALAREDGTCFVQNFQLLPHEGNFCAENEKFVERLLKKLFWIKGGSRIHFFGPEEILKHLERIFSPTGPRYFDAHFMGSKLSGEPLSFTHHRTEDTIPAEKATVSGLGRNLEGCRIGFDLGGSDRKTAAVIDGQVVFSEEVPWDPYFKDDPVYHLEGIRHSLNRAAEHLPQVDAIGGSAAGIYVNNTVRVASLFRGVKDKARYEKEVRPIFHQLQKEWGNIPFDVINDGDVTALAAAMQFEIHSVLGIAMGTSMAVGYCDPQGQLTPGINELAFLPVDDHPDAPIDEWSGDHGCGVQYFSQQAVARHAKDLGYQFGDLPYPEQLIEIQKAIQEGDPNAHIIFERIGSDLAHSIENYADFYEIENLLLLGRVTSGEGGEVILDTAKKTLAESYPERAEKISFVIPDETMKRHGQAIAAASLPREYQE